MLVGVGSWEGKDLHLYPVICSDNTLKHNGFIRDYVEQKVWRISSKIIMTDYHDYDDSWCIGH